jgi:hypothetical protein
VLWRGAPDPSVFFSKSDLRLIPFSLMFCAIATGYMVDALTDGDYGFAAVGTPFAAIGVYLVVGRFFYKRWDRKRTEYVVTDRRAVVVRRGEIGDVGLSAPMTVLRRKDGKLGSVTWSVTGVAPQRDADLMFELGWLSMAKTGHVAFVDVADIEGLLTIVNRYRALGRSDNGRHRAAAHANATTSSPVSNRVKSRKGEYERQRVKRTPPR